MQLSGGNMIYSFDDLRIDEDEFKKLDQNTLETLAPLYHSTNINLLAKLIRRNR